MKKTLPILALVLLFCGCTRQAAKRAAQGPFDVVKDFVQLSAAAKDASDKQKLADLCTGEMKSAFERMTDEAFRISYLGSNLKIQALKALPDLSADANAPVAPGKAPAEGDSATVRYQVTVENKQGTDPTQEINQREVVLKRLKEGWFIESVRLQGSDQIVFNRGMIF